MRHHEQQKCDIFFCARVNHSLDACDHARCNTRWCARLQLQQKARGTTLKE